jgi:hypothetical protein
VRNGEEVTRPCGKVKKATRDPREIKESHQVTEGRREWPPGTKRMVSTHLRECEEDLQVPGVG